MGVDPNNRRDGKRRDGKLPLTKALLVAQIEFTEWRNGRLTAFCGIRVCQAGG
jgi:hypothetical protein